MWRVVSDYIATECAEGGLPESSCKGQEHIKVLGVCRRAVSDLLNVTVRTLHHLFATPASYKKS